MNARENDTGEFPGGIMAQGNNRRTVRPARFFNREFGFPFADRFIRGI